MQFNRFTHVNDTPAVQNSGILQFFLDKTSKFV